ncbi:MAG: glycosyltransferase [Candidatus Promineifilaceae bacterium]
MSLISTIICTHNPNPRYLAQTIEALKQQTLPTSAWELIVVDNNSQPKLTDEWVTWHPQGRIVTESRLGLAYARFRGIEAAAGDLLVFVDDDNLLAPDYLDSAEKIFQTTPTLGVGGANHIKPQYEGTPPEWIDQYAHWLAISKPNSTTTLSTHPFDSAAMPYGAGIIIRKQFAEAYARKRDDKNASGQLGRTGDRLIGGEEYDMTIIAAHAGAIFGKFDALRLTHIIPTRRFSIDYLQRLMHDSAYSGVKLELLWGQTFLGRGMFRHNRAVLYGLKWLAPLIHRNRQPHLTFFQSKISGMLLALEEGFSANL